MTKPPRKWILLFLMPTVLLFLLVFAAPLVTIVATSFTNWRPGEKIGFVGLGNYIRLFTDDPTFGKSVTNTFKWIFLQCTVHVGLGVLIALLTQKPTRFSKFVRAVYVIPNIMAPAAIATLFYFIFHPTIGMVNGFIKVFINPTFAKNWYFEKDTAFLAVTMTTILFSGIITLIIASHISSIDACLYESAKIDGTNAFQDAIFITLPLVRSSLATVLILAAAQALRSFEVVYLTTNGGPGVTTMNFPVYMYYTYTDAGKYGYGNSMGVLLIVFGIIVMKTVHLLMKEEA